MEFFEVEKTLKSFFPYLSNYNYDGIIVKKLEASNTWDSDRTTKQTHIAITGEQMDIFPYLTSEGYFNCDYSEKDDILKKFFVTMIPVSLHKENLDYLGIDVSNIDKFNTLSCVIRSRRDGAADQIQFALPTYDDNLFILYRQHLHTGDYLIILKRKNELLYDSVAIKGNEKNLENIDKFNNHFYKLPTNTKIDISNFIKIEKDDDLSIDDLAKILSDSYNSAGENQKVVTIHVFGIKFAKTIIKNAYKVSEIIEKAGLNSSYGTELSKGIGIYKYIIENFNKIEDSSVDDLEKLIRVSSCKKFFLNNFLNDKLHTRYIHSLLSKPFVILSGNSGTGKTRIASRFAKYLEKKNDSGIINHLLIPVGADWTDNTKILGYYNPLADNGTGKYEKTDVFKFIELAGANPEIPFFLILDEMNLSHVERYFSDFLSKMELLDYTKPAEKVYFDITGYGKLELPKNLFITGTVNIDETTYMFSPKVLDRANVIEFKPDMDDVLDNLLDASNDEDEKIAGPGVAEGFMKLANDIRSGKFKTEVQPLLEEIKPILESFYKELEKCGFEFAYRTVKEIRLYVIAAYKTAVGEKPTATEIADIQILQKILPKIHGNKKQIGNLLDELEKLCEEKSLPNSLAKIQQMKDKLNRFQYASFI